MEEIIDRIEELADKLEDAQDKLRMAIRQEWPSTEEIEEEIEVLTAESERILALMERDSESD